MCARRISESADYPMVENVLDEKLLNRSKPSEERPQVTQEGIITEKEAIENCYKSKRWPNNLLIQVLC